LSCLAWSSEFTSLNSHSHAVWRWCYGRGQRTKHLGHFHPPAPRHACFLPICFSMRNAINLVSWWHGISGVCRKNRWRKQRGCSSGLLPSLQGAMSASSSWACIFNFAVPKLNVCKCAGRCAPHEGPGDGCVQVLHFMEQNPSKYMNLLSFNFP